ncbi:cell envelope biogenesis protein OmpA [uncultured Muriicola sp.]|uniref:TolB family protein n=1 Tax=uncultured Muriicola sp. TaxID=1583102 RepID=UPI00260679FD|nr:cell envelope biogenesis protein OmpA [uncultured Muriicola sp.]
MKNFTLIVNTALGGLMLLLCTNVLAQQKKTANISQTQSLEADKRIEDYLKLSKLGYSEKEIFEDLGNVSFLIEDFRTAAFWYQKLIDLSGTEAVSQSYIERYKVAMHKAGIANYGDELAQADWHAQIKEDYQVAKKSPYRKLTPSLAQNNRRPTFSAAEWSSSMEALNKLAGLSDQRAEVLKLDRRLPEKGYIPPVTVSADRKTAFFSKATYVQPEYGIFSKKDLVYKIYKTENINGQWMNVTEIGVCPKYASAIHPTISPDGKRLFFASDMPGSFGKYDIYVADIKKDGSVGIAKNLGQKVNTKKNDMYPNLVGGELLFFASNGRDGEGGLDLFAVQVGTKRVGMAVNIGAPFNSKQDDYAFNIKAETGVAIVMSNRGDLDNKAQQLVFSVSDIQKSLPAQNRKNNFLELLPRDANSVYTNIYYQD